MPSPSRQHALLVSSILSHPVTDGVLRQTPASLSSVPVDSANNLCGVNLSSDALMRAPIPATLAADRVVR